jgi:transketolase N-terminal domain/subunit
MTTTEPASTIGLDTVAELAAQLRVDSVRSSTSAGSGHPTSSMSAADLLAVLITRHLSYDWDQPRLPANDHLIFSKGHASPLLYSVFKAVGVVSEDEPLNGYRRFGQRLEGHPTPVLPWVDVATGSLGQGLPDGVGVALAGKYLERLPYRVWVLCGDSELAEGSIWEAFDKASYYKLSNLIAIADINRLGQRGETDLGWNLEGYQRRLEAFGARVLTVDGHDLAAIDQAMTAAADASGGQPAVILAKTVKGRGFSEVENSGDWHGKPLPPDMAERAIAELGGVRGLVLRGPRPEPAEPGPVPGKPATVPQQPAAEAKPSAAPPQYEVGKKVATRKAYGDALVALGARDDRIVALCRRPRSRAGSRSAGPVPRAGRAPARLAVHAGPLAQCGHLGLQPAGLFLQFQDALDPGQVQPVGGQRADVLQPADVPAGVPAGPARAARRVEQPFPLVDPQRLRVQPGQLGGDRDAEQAPVQVRPPGVHHGQPQSPARYCTASSARVASLTTSSSAAREAAAGAGRGTSTQTGPARSCGSGTRPASLTATGTPKPCRHPAGAPA